MPGVTGSPISEYGYTTPYANYGVPVPPNIRRSVGGLAVALTVFLALDAPLAVLLTAAMAWRHALISRMLDDYTSVDRDTVVRSDHLVASSAGFLVLALLPTIVLFLCWFWAARNNAEAYAPDEGTMRVGWSIGGWFIPFANWVIPCIVARDIYKGTMNSRKDKTWGGGKITGFWWAAYLVSAISLGVMTGTKDSSDDPVDHLRTLRTVAGIAEFALPALAVAALLAIGYVWTITKTQKLRNATGDWPGGPGSAGGPAMYGMPPMPYGYGPPMPGYPPPVQDWVPTPSAPVQDRVPVADTQVAETQTAEVVSAEPPEQPGNGLVPPS
jgi:hypothetical protein